MSADQFWRDDPWLAAGYRRAYELRKQETSDHLWLMGLYNFNAVSVAVSNAFRKKGTRPQKYMEEPLRVIPYTEEENTAVAERERQKAIDYFNKLADRWGRKK